MCSPTILVQLPSVAQERLTPNQKFLHGRQRFVLLTDKWTLRILIQPRRDIAAVEGGNFFIHPAPKANANDTAKFHTHSPR